ncbi:hypothetical protein quinque_007089 [Culex quinquefasciatus]
MVGKFADEQIPKSAQHPPESLSTILTCLQVCVGNVSPDVTEVIMGMSQYNLLEEDLFGPHSVDISQIVDDSSGSISRLTKQWNLKTSSWLGVIHGRRCFLSSLYQEGGSQYTEEDVPR